VYSQQISADVVPGPEPRYYTTYLTGTQGQDEGAHGEIALFQEMRTTNLVPKTSAYQIAVEKACVDTKALPSFIAQVDTSSNNPSGDPNQLQSLVGFEMNWSGSMFPATQNGATIAVNTTTLSSSTPTLYSFFSTGGSSLPIKYSRSSYGVMAGVDLKKTAPACEGILEAFVENNPNSAYWLGQYSFNLDIQVFLTSFNRALTRAFGMWEPIAPAFAYTAQPLQVAAGSSQWKFVCSYTTPQLVGYDFSQVLVASTRSVGTGPSLYTELNKLTVDFYPVTATGRSGAGGINQQLVFPCNAATSAYLTNYQKLYGTPPNLQMSLYMANLSYGSVPVASVATGTTTQTLPSSTQIAVPTSTNVVNADNMATLTFSLSTTPAGNAQTATVPCFDFYQGISSTKVQCSDTSVTLPNQIMGPVFQSPEPTRTDYLTSAYLLGFLPDTVFNLVQTVGATVFANRPLAPAFSTKLDLASYQALKWKPSDAYAASSKPLPGSPYYYGYGTTYYLSNVVNPGIASCFQNEFDKYFTGDLPARIMDKLLLEPNINAITDLSLNAQLYCLTYFNSATAPIAAIQQIKPWIANEVYSAGTPVTFANTDPSSPINNLYIANTLTGSDDAQPPTPFQNNEYWLYCGPFIYSSAVVGGLYMDGELVTYNGFANRMTSEATVATGGVISSANGYKTHRFLSSGTFTLSSTPASSIGAQILLVGGGGAGGTTGGGGAGGAVFTTTTISLGANTITVGAGGTGFNTTPTQGGNTQAFNFTAAGGGAGGTNTYFEAPSTSLNGGCGGGGNASGGTFGSTTNAGGQGSQGFNGGISNANNVFPYGGGGGGGMGGVGGACGPGGLSPWGVGGAGKTYVIGGISYTVSGGGAGSVYGSGTNAPTAPIPGGIGGGGQGAWSGGDTNNTPGTPNTGGGGGAGKASVTNYGGSGIVIISYPIIRSPKTFTGLFGTPMTLVPRDPKTEAVAAGGIVTTDGSYVYHTFTSDLENPAFTLLNPSIPLNVSVLAIGGGGGGGGASMGGGGGGGFQAFGTATISQSNTNVTIGRGGAGGTSAINVVATGGQITHLNGYTYHYFSSDDTFTLTSPAAVDIQYLLVGGGGGGGGASLPAGGGGGGQVVFDGYSLPSGVYPVKIGAGGQGSRGDVNQPGENGEDSKFNTASATGGGGGGNYNASGGVDGQNGACGGGGGGCSNSASGGLGGEGQNPDLNNGGNGNLLAGGGGGGWNSQGRDGIAPDGPDTSIGGKGGDGAVVTLMGGGSPVTCSAGGGGGGQRGGNGGEAGGYTIGGNGGTQIDPNGVDGAPNSGSGGGGCGANEGIDGSGGMGGSGCLYIVYKSIIDVPTQQGQSGTASSFLTLTAAGGAGGGGGTTAGGGNGSDGPSGGGGSFTGTGGSGNPSPPGYQGGDGGTGEGGPCAGGGGGMGGRGFNGAESGNQGTGGFPNAALIYNISYLTCAGGGGGGQNVAGGSDALAGEGGTFGYNGTDARSDLGSRVGFGGGGGGAGLSDDYLLFGGSGADGLVVIAYPVQDYIYFGQYNLLKPNPVVGTAPPLFTLNTKPGAHGDVFEIQADTYGFGTYDSNNPRDPIHAYARDSWGCLQSNATSFITNRIYDEFLLFQSNTAFWDMFRGFSTTSEKYVNQLTGQTSVYWVYDFILDPAEMFRPEMPLAWSDAQVMNDGITQSSLKYLPSRMVSSNTASTTSPAYLRNSDSQVYYWTIGSSETSRYSMWDPVQSIIIEGNTVPVNSDNLPVSEPVTTQVQRLSGDSRLLLAEFFPRVNPAEDTAIYEPQFGRQIYLASGTELKYFSYRISWRNKFTGEIVPLILSSVGSAMVVFMFTPKN
jgi:hypothetical protein